MVDVAELIFRWLHIIPAIIMVGGVCFMRFCLETQEGTDSYLDQNQTARKSWSKLVMLCTLLLLVSGLFNAGKKAVAYELSGTYLGLLAIKIVLALVILFFVALYSGRSDGATRFRQGGKGKLNLILGLMIALVMIAGFMKVDSVDFPLKETGPDTETAAAVQR